MPVHIEAVRSVCAHLTVSEEYPLPDQPFQLFDALDLRLLRDDIVELWLDRLKPDSAHNARPVFPPPRAELETLLRGIEAENRQLRERLSEQMESDHPPSFGAGSEFAKSWGSKPRSGPVPLLIQVSGAFRNCRQGGLILSLPPAPLAPDRGGFGVLSDSDNHPKDAEYGVEHG